MKKIILLIILLPFFSYSQTIKVGFNGQFMNNLFTQTIELYQDSIKEELDFEYIEFPFNESDNVNEKSQEKDLDFSFDPITKPEY